MCRSLLTEAERAALVDLVAATPLIGTALGGGLRKFRFARPGGGKSGGYRVIHYFKADIDGPFFCS